MNEKTRGIFRLIVGGYLIYLGVSLSMDVIKAKPTNYVIFIIAGILFAAVGAFLVIKNIKNVIDGSKSGDDSFDDEEEDDRGLDVSYDEEEDEELPADDSEGDHTEE